VGFDESSESQIKKGAKAGQKHRQAITAIKEALTSTQCEKQPAQEPDAGKGPIVGTKTWFEDGKVVSQNIHMADMYNDPPTAPAQPLSLEDSLAVAKPCCGEYASCNRPCTPRGRWEAQQSQQSLTDDEIIKLADYHTTYQIESPSTSGMIDFARAIEAKLKKNT
jgi:hypothetical protein